MRLLVAGAGAMSDPRYQDVGTIEVRLSEELAELIQVVQKAQRWGWAGVNPDDRKTKLERAIEEMGDVVARWNELARREGLPGLLFYQQPCAQKVDSATLFGRKVE